jgi:hypothetical protein
VFPGKLLGLYFLERALVFAVASCSLAASRRSNPGPRSFHGHRRESRASDISGEACSRFPREDHPSTELGLHPHWNSSGFLGPVKSRERPVLVSCREDHSSTELGLPQHGNFSELQTPVAHWKGHRTGRARDFSS